MTPSFNAMPINYASTSTPLSCQQFNENLDYLIKRENHTGVQSADTIYDLNEKISELNNYRSIVNLVTELDEKIANLGNDLFGNGALAELIAEIRQEIENLKENLQLEISRLEIWQNLTDIVDTNKDDLSILKNDKETQDLNIRSLTTNLTTLTNTYNEKIVEIDENTSSISNLTLQIDNLVTEIDKSYEQSSTNTQNISENLKQLNEQERLLTEKIDRLNSYAFTTRLKLDKYPTPTGLSENYLQQDLVNTKDGVVFRSSNFLKDKIITVPGDFNTIAEALTFLRDKILSNVTLQLSDTTYYENLNFAGFSTVYKNLIINGRGVDRTKIIGEIRIIALSTSIEIKNLTVEAESIPKPMGIFAVNKINLNLESVLIKNFPQGINITSYSTASLNNVKIDNCSDIGLVASNASVNISNCDFLNSRLGVQVSDGSSVFMNKCNVRFNDRGIINRNSTLKLDNSLISNNTINGIDNLGLARITDCSFTSNNGSGIVSTHQGHTEVYDSLCDYNREYGMVSFNNGSLVAYNCTSANNLLDGYFCTNVSYMLVNNCRSNNNQSYGYRSSVNSVLYAYGTASISSDNTLGQYSPAVSGSASSESSGGLLFFN